jgi:hypothetical protein
MKSKKILSNKIDKKKTKEMYKKITRFINKMEMKGIIIDDIDVIKEYIRIANKKNYKMKIRLYIEKD